MHCRDISRDEFDVIASELARARHQAGAIEVVSGHHHNHGATIVIRDATRCMALVENPSFLDMMDKSALSAEIRLRREAIRH